jgi:hypothetical protein
MAEGRESGTPLKAGIKITEQGVGVYEAVNLPNDPNLLDLFGKWADAWGKWTWEQKKTDLDSPSANELAEKEDEAADALKSALKAKGYKDVRVLNGTIIFDDGRVQLTH